MKIKRKIHVGYTEFLNIKKNKKLFGKYPIKQYFGKFQYIYTSEKGQISLVLLKNYDFISNKDLWEIYELSDNKLFEDVERFRTKAQAEKRIRELLK